MIAAYFCGFVMIPAIIGVIILLGWVFGLFETNSNEFLCGLAGMVTWVPLFAFILSKVKL